MTHRWQDWLNVVASAWLLLSAWLFDFSGDAVAQWTFVVVGALISVLALFNFERLSATATEWLVVLFGVVIFATPWIFNFAQASLRWNAWIVGASAALLALWSLAQEGSSRGRRATDMS